MEVNYYEILGLNNNATQEEIKAAYRSLSKKYHPDVNDSANASTLFRMIKESYDTLIDDNKRHNYDNPSYENEEASNNCNTNDAEYDTESYATRMEHLKDLMKRLHQIPHKKVSIGFKLLTFVPILMIRTVCLIAQILVGIIYMALYIFSHLSVWLSAGLIILAIIYFLSDLFGSGFDWLIFGVFLVVVIIGIIFPIICKIIVIPFSIIFNKLSSYTFSPFWY